MSLNGLKGGIDLRMTRAYPARRAFLRGELRYAGGRVDYTSNGTGSSSGEPDWYIEGRALIGNDWPLNAATVSPYIGLGYRFLLNDGRGITSTGATGYRRESTYLYLPVGIILRTGLDSGDEMAGSFEYDHLLSGNQFTKLSDVGAGYGDLDNKQNKGYGVKLRLSYATAHWSFGPYLHYWNIADSDWKPLYQFGVPVFDNNGNPDGGIEPSNRTTEIGLEFNQPF